MWSGGCSRACAYVCAHDVSCGKLDSPLSSSESSSLGFSILPQVAATVVGGVGWGAVGKG